MTCIMHDASMNFCITVWYTTSIRFLTVQTKCRAAGWPVAPPAADEDGRAPVLVNVRAAPPPPATLPRAIGAPGNPQPGLIPPSDKVGVHKDEYPNYSKYLKYRS